MRGGWLVALQSLFLEKKTPLRQESQVRVGDQGAIDRDLRQECQMAAATT